MVLANPPYYADFQIAERFIEAALRNLRPEGRLVMVTKQVKWYEENLHRWLDDVEVFPSRKYFIASGIKAPTDHLNDWFAESLAIGRAAEWFSVGRDCSEDAG